MSGESKSTIKEGTSSAKTGELKYLNGFGNQLESEALEGALPKGQFMPQKCAYGLYAEQLSGTAFTAPRVANQRSWLYRILPTCVHEPLKPVELNADKLKEAKAEAMVSSNIVSEFGSAVIEPNQLRWKPFPMPADGTKVNFLQGMNTLGGCGGPDTKTGFAIHIYACNTSMGDTSFCNSDGDYLIVPQQGTLTIQTEFGILKVPPRFIAVVQRGIRFKVDIDEPSRGYMLELFSGHFKIPDLGPIGANGLANPRDFEHPTAHFEHTKGTYTLVQKFLGKFFHTSIKYCPFNVVAWAGNYVPYRYNLDHFIAVNTVVADHADPSIFTVLTAPTLEPGVAVCDFVIFPPRWLVAEHTFRPPYYHRNCMTEFMGNICGRYEAKPEGFLPGGGSLHSCMIGHGPDADTFTKSSNAELAPTRLPDDSLAFMFESTYIMRLTEWGAKAPKDENYYQCWQSLPEEFDASKPSSA